MVEAAVTVSRGVTAAVHQESCCVTVCCHVFITSLYGSDMMSYCVPCEYSVYWLSLCLGTLFAEGLLHFDTLITFDEVYTASLQTNSQS